MQKNSYLLQSNHGIHDEQLNKLQGAFMPDASEMGISEMQSISFLAHGLPSPAPAPEQAWGCYSPPCNSSLRYQRALKNREGQHPESKIWRSHNWSGKGK